MDVKVTRTKGSSGRFSIECDSEFMEALSDEAQKTSTAMVNILRSRLLPSAVESEADFHPMPREFAKRWVRFPQVIRAYIVSTARNIKRPISVAYLANLITGSYKRSKSDWDENLEAYGEMPPLSPYPYFLNTLGVMVEILMKYRAIIGDQRGFSFASKKKIDEFVDNDVDFGEWQDDIYGLREKQARPIHSSEESVDDEEDTFD